MSWALVSLKPMALVMVGRVNFVPVMYVSQLFQVGGDGLMTYHKIKPIDRARNRLEYKPSSSEAPS